MYQKILSELIKQNPGRSKVFLGVLATALATKITDETTLEGQITELTNHPLFSVEEQEKVWQKEGDRRANEAVNTYKLKNPNPNDPPQPPNPPGPGDPPPPGETPAEKKIREMEERLNAFEKKDKDAANRQALIAKLKEKKIHESFADNVVITDDANLDEIVNGIETKYNDVKQSIINEGFQQNSFVPGQGVTNPGGATAVDADIANWAKQNNPPAPAAAAK